ncbi:MAG: redoxin domain-containing protein, partial [Planctomycetaceae bacterium]
MSRLTICTLLALSACTAMAEEATFDSLELKDTYGKSHNLSTLGNKKLTVVVFLGTECPLAKLYGPRMRQLAARFADQDVAFIGVNSNVQDSLTEVAAYVNRAKIQFPMLLDTEHKLADLPKAERTPEVFVLDAKRTIRYRGRIDDQYAISVARDKPKTEDLANALTSLLAGDGPATKRTEAIGCIIGRRRNTEPTGEITYSKHVAPIFNKRCVECHRSGELAPFPLASFEDTVGWTDMIAEVISEGRMPPWNANPEFGHFQNDARLTADEKNTVLTWIKNGAPEGSKDDLPDPPKFVEGWRIEKPDVFLKMDSIAFSVPATGVVDYQHFYVDLNLKEDVWVNAVEARPGNPEVVHHIVVYLKIPGQKRD